MSQEYIDCHYLAEQKILQMGYKELIILHLYGDDIINIWPKWAIFTILRPVKCIVCSDNGLS